MSMVRSSLNAHVICNSRNSLFIFHLKIMIVCCAYGGVPQKLWASIRLKNSQKKPFATIALHYKSKKNFKSYCIPLTLFNFYIHLTNQLHVARLPSFFLSSSLSFLLQIVHLSDLLIKSVGLQCSMD